MKKILIFIIFSITITSNILAGTVYYVDAANGNDNNPGTESLPWKTIQKSANAMVAGDTVIVKAGIYNERVTENTSGSQDNLITYKVNSGDTVKVYGFNINGNYVKLDGFDIEAEDKPAYNTNGTGIYITSDYCEVWNCEIHECTYGAIILENSADHCTVKQNYIWECALMGMQALGTNHLIEDNEFYDMRCKVKNVNYYGNDADADGIWIGNTGNGTIIRGNYFHGTTFANNTGYHPHIDAIMAYPTPRYGFTIERNFVDWSTCACPQESGDELCGFMIATAYNVTIRNNILKTEYKGINAWDVDSGYLIIVNNTIIGDLDKQDEGLGGNSPLGITISGSSGAITIENNIIQDFRGDYGAEVWISGCSNLTYDYNCIYRSLGSPSTNPGPQPFDVWDQNPKFVNPSAKNYHLQSDSPCKDIGANLSGLVDNDHDGNPRPYNGWYDIGAYEYIGENPTLNVNVDASPTSGENPLTVNFTSNAMGGTSPYSFSWDFGDGGYSTEQNPSHTYYADGNYTAILTVTDNEDSQDSDSVTITVTVPLTPVVASSSASPNSGDSPLTVDFTGNATGGTPPYSYYWNFGDGQSSSQQNPSHTYNNAGNYSVIFTVRDSNNTQDSDSLTISVTAPPPPPLVASCIASPTSGDVPFTVYFTGSASGGTPPYSYSWNFGDGGNSTQQNPSHIYNAAGNYTATLTVTDSQSIQDNVSLTIIATSSPAQAYLSCSPANLFFGASVSGTQPSSQYLRIINAGDGTMNWNVQESTAWLSCSPLSGTNRGQVTVSVNATGLSPGTYDAIITASSPQAYNSPQLIEVNLRVYESGVDIPDGNPFSERDSVVGLTLNDIKARRAGIKKNSDPNNPTEAVESGGLVTMVNTLIADNSTEKGNLERPDESNTPYQKDETGILTIGLKEIRTGLRPRSSVDIDTEEDRIAIDHAEKPASIKQKSQLENERENINIKRVQIEEMEPLRIIFTSSLKENISFIGWGEDEQTALPNGSTLRVFLGPAIWIHRQIRISLCCNRRFAQKPTSLH